MFCSPWAVHEIDWLSKFFCLQWIWNRESPYLLQPSSINDLLALVSLPHGYGSKLHFGGFKSSCPSCCQDLGTVFWQASCQPLKDCCIEGAPQLRLATCWLCDRTFGSFGNGRIPKAEWSQFGCPAAPISSAVIRNMFGPMIILLANQPISVCSNLFWISSLTAVHLHTLRGLSAMCHSPTTLSRVLSTQRLALTMCTYPHRCRRRARKL